MSKDNISSEATMQPRRRRVIERLVFGGIYLVLTLGTGFLEFRVLTALDHHIWAQEVKGAAFTFLFFYFAIIGVLKVSTAEPEAKKLRLIRRRKYGCIVFAVLGGAALAYLSFYVTSSSLHSKYPGLTPQEVLKESIAFWTVGLMIAMEWYVPVVILKKLLIKRVFGKSVVNVHAD